MLDVFENCFEKAEFIHLKKKVATLHYNVGLQLDGLQAISILKIAATMFQQIGDHTSIDAAQDAIKKKQMTIEWQVNELTLPTELYEKFLQEIDACKERLTQLSKDGAVCADLLSYLFDNHRLPLKQNIEKQSINIPITYLITTVSAMTEGRSGYLNSIKEKEEHWIANIFNTVLFTYSLYKNYQILEWFIKQYGIDDLKNCLTGVYQKSIIYDEGREELITIVIEKYLKNDIVGFVYSVIPQIEDSLKRLLENTGVSVCQRDIQCLEDIPLNTILQNYKLELINILGENFYDVLWLCFEYRFGLNVRNSLVHGGGLSYLNKQYALLLFFIIGFIFYRAYKLQMFDDQLERNFII
ncbi:MAG: DUF4209 domain-containing protein [Nitrospirae bacterium]|nr:DUF4209 domain-containing protein [Nitrospirota bacterium]